MQPTPLSRGTWPASLSLSLALSEHVLLDTTCIDTYTSSISDFGTVRAGAGCTHFFPHSQPTNQLTSQPANQRAPPPPKPPSGGIPDSGLRELPQLLPSACAWLEGGEGFTCMYIWYGIYTHIIHRDFFFFFFPLSSSSLSSTDGRTRIAYPRAPRSPTRDIAAAAMYIHTYIHTYFPPHLRVSVSHPLPPPPPPSSSHSFVSGKRTKRGGGVRRGIGRPKRQVGELHLCVSICIYASTYV